VNLEPAGFSVDLGELEVLAREADALSETIRTVWQQDWFEDNKWPDSDPLRTAVIAYRRSLQAAMERLCGGTDQLAVRLRVTADIYRDTDARVAGAFEPIASGQ
jgi:hypothetical protein